MPEAAVLSSKIVSPGRAADWASRMRHGGYQIVQAHGVFDLLHPGHVRYLESARRQGDRLVVSVTADAYVNKGPGKPVFPAELRAEMLAALACVDLVTINPLATSVELIRDIQPHVYVKGPDYALASGDIDLERRAVEAHGGRLHFTDDATFSSSEIINQHIDVGSEAAREYLAGARTRHYRHLARDLIESVKEMSVLFIGEQIVDEYVYVSPLGKPPKEFVIASLQHETEVFAGGITAAARHAQSFVKAVKVISNRSVTKRRYVDKDFNRKLFEIYQMNDKPALWNEEDELIEQVKHLAPLHDVTVVVDFGHGMLTDKVRTQIRESSHFLAVNAQSNSANHGFNPVTNYSADYICVDLPEARLAAGKQHGGATECGAMIRQFAPKVVITDGRRGSVALDGGVPKQVPTFTEKVVDTMGAGDAFLAVTAPLAKLSDDLELVALIGNIAGGIKVGTVGHREPVSKDQVLRYIDGLLK